MIFKSKTQEIDPADFDELVEANGIDTIASTLLIIPYGDMMQIAAEVGALLSADPSMPVDAALHKWATARMTPPVMTSLSARPAVTKPVSAAEQAALAQGSNAAG